MDKFPLLKIYRSLLLAAAVIFLILGVLTVLAPTLLGYNYNYRPNLIALLVLALPWFGVALGIGVSAELITLFLHIEDHLDKMRRAQEATNEALRRMIGSSSLPPTQVSIPSASLTASTGTATPAMRATIITGGANLYSHPDMKSVVQEDVMRGAVISVYARTRDNKWLSANSDATLWVVAMNVTLDGDISALPAITPPPPVW